MSKKTTNPPAQPGGVPQGSRRAQLAADQERAAQERRVRNWVTMGILAVGLLAIVGTIVWAVVNASRAPQVSSPTAGTSDNYTVVVGKADAPVTLAIYQDYMCPYCGEFERANRADLASLVDSGKARVEFHPMAFLDQASQGTKFSTRAANALVTVAKAQPDKVLDFNAALFDNQPQENTAGLSDAEIATIARGAGVTDDVVASFASLKNANFVANATSAAFASGVTGTPTVKINSEVFAGNLYAAGPLKTAVEAAAGAAATPSQTASQ
ncbi:MAG: thioredoxin domain-containing protein [Propionicimonas sp.]